MKDCRFDNNLILEVAQDILWEAMTKYGAAVVVLINNKEEVLLLKRQKDVAWQPNKWGYAGGGIEKGETPIQAAKREVKEETNLVIKTIHKLSTAKEDDTKVHYFWCDDFSGKPKINEEHQEFKWVKLSNISKMDVVPKTKDLAKKVFEDQKKLNEDNLVRDPGSPPNEEPVQPSAKVVSFDFDDTLFGVDDGEPNHTLIAKAQEYASKAVDVYVVSTRKNIPHNSQYIHKLIKDYDIPAKKVVLTNGEPKWKTLVDLDVDIHYDDDRVELRELEKNSPSIKPIWVKRFLVFEGGIGGGDGYYAG